MRLQAMSFGALLDATFRLYAHLFPRLAAVTLLCNLPTFGVLTYLAAQHVTIQGLVHRPSLLLPYYGAIVLCKSLAMGSVILMVSEGYLGRRVSALAAIRGALKRFFPLVGAQLLVSLAVGLGSLCLIFPGVWLAFGYALVMPALMLEGLGPTSAMIRSERLVGLQRRKVVAVTACIYLLMLLLVWSVGLAWNWLWMLTPWGDDVSLQFLGTRAIGMLTQPLDSLALVLLYYDLRIRHEGFDLEGLSHEMETHGLLAPA